jgi:hypothetical protein
MSVQGVHRHWDLPHDRMAALSAEICLAYRRTQRSAAVRNFVAVARRQAQIATQQRN